MKTQNFKTYEVTYQNVNTGEAFEKVFNNVDSAVEWVADECERDEAEFDCFELTGWTFDGNGIDLSRELY